MGRLLDNLGKVTLALSIAGFVISLLIYIVRGPAVYLFLLLGVLLRPLLSLLLLLVSVKLCSISFADSLGRDWNVQSLTPGASRASLIRDACTVTLLAFTLVFWYRYGGLGPSARNHPSAPDSTKKSSLLGSESIGGGKG